MARKLIATTDDAELQPTMSASLGFRFVQDLVRRHLGADAAAMLAEPQPIGGEGRRQWMTDAPLGAAATRLGEASPENAQVAWVALCAVRARAAEVRGRLAASREDGARQEGELLIHVFEVPDDARDVWVVGGRPVLVAWGNVATDARPANVSELAIRYRQEIAPPAGPLSSPGVAPRGPVLPAGPPSALSPTPPPAATASVATAHRTGLLAPLLWVAFGLASLAVAALLLWGCAVAIPGTGLQVSFPGSCRLPPLRRPDDLLARSVALSDAIAHARLELAERPVCPEPAVAPAPAPRPAPPPVPEQPRGCVEAGCERGELQITLVWASRDDLDLTVSCPGGEVSFSSPERAGCSGGRLDVDANNAVMMNQPVENVSWAHAPPAGRYAITASLWGRRDTTGPIAFEVQVRLGGQFRSCRGSLERPHEERRVLEFSLPGTLPECSRG